MPLARPAAYGRGMESTMMFIDCPAYLDQDGAARCGLPAEVRCRFTMRSTSGPLESAMIRCPAGHWFNGPIEFITLQGSHSMTRQARISVADLAVCASSQWHAGHQGTDGSALAGPLAASARPGPEGGAR
jgi:hypothetical protein